MIAAYLNIYNVYKIGDIIYLIDMKFEIDAIYLLFNTIIGRLDYHIKILLDL